MPDLFNRALQVPKDLFSLLFGRRFWTCFKRLRKHRLLSAHWCSQS